MMRLIDADALMREFAFFVRDSNNSDFADVPTWNDAVSLLGSAPTVDPVKRGMWIPVWHFFTLDSMLHETTFYCTECGKEAREKGRYCPNCGAMMEDDK